MNAESAVFTLSYFHFDFWNLSLRSYQFKCGQCDLIFSYQFMDPKNKIAEIQKLLLPCQALTQEGQRGTAMQSPQKLKIQIEIL